MEVASIKSRNTWSYTRYQLWLLMEAQPRLSSIVATDCKLWQVALTILTQGSWNVIRENLFAILLGKASLAFADVVSQNLEEAETLMLSKKRSPNNDQRKRVKIVTTVHNIDCKRPRWLRCMSHIIDECCSPGFVARKHLSLMISSTPTSKYPRTVPFLQHECFSVSYAVKE